MPIGPNEYPLKMVRERRSSPRFALDAPVMLLSRSGWAIARTVNVSRCGVAVVCSNLDALVGLKANHLYFELPKLTGIDTDAHLVRVSEAECAFAFDRCPHDAEVALRAWLHSCVIRAAHVGWPNSRRVRATPSRS